MKLQQNPEPPALIIQLFRWFCKPELVEEIEGDLVEQYQLNHQLKGSFKAKLKLLKEVILLFRPSIYGSLQSKLLWVFGPSDVQRGILIVLFMLIAQMLLRSEYEHYTLLLTSLLIVFIDIVKLVQIRNQEKVQGHQIFIERKRDLIFKIVFIAGFLVVWYLLYYAIKAWL
jgi:hypothetical protein